MEFNDLKKYGIGVGLLVLLVISIGFNIFFEYRINKIKSEENNSSDESLVSIVEEEQDDISLEEEDVEVYFTVDIKGAVKKSGVYELKEGSRVQDVIKAAGGLKSNASTKNINLSKKISDEMVIYIYTTSELKKLSSQTTDEVCVSSSQDISSCSGASIVEVSGSDSSSNNNSNSTSSTSSMSKVSINTGTKEELMTLSGIGESKALAIIEYRNTNGEFKSLEDIMNVSGIGEAAYNKIKDYITL